jgi:hypothetical protein
MQSQSGSRQGTLSIRVHASTTGQYQVSVDDQIVSSGVVPSGGSTLLVTRTVSWQSTEHCRGMEIEAQIIPFEGPARSTDSSVRLCDAETELVDLYL